MKESTFFSLAGKKIYFGHQSVGFNMMDGITMHLNENPAIDIEISEGIESEDYVGFSGLKTKSHPAQDEDCL